MAKSWITVSFTYSLRIATFWTDISQGSVATRLGCGLVCKYNFITNFLLSLTVKECWKSVNIWWCCGQEFGVLFFDSQCSCKTAVTALRIFSHHTNMNWSDQNCNLQQVDPVTCTWRVNWPHASASRLDWLGCIDSIETWTLRAQWVRNACIPMPLFTLGFSVLWTSLRS